MKDKRYTNRDLNLLSAYLDNALSGSVRRKVEERLKQEPALQERLDGLRNIKHVMGALPRQKSPRNFVLSADLVTVRKSKRSHYSGLRLASILAAALMVVLVGFEFILAPIITPSRKPVEAELAFELDQESAPPLIIWGPPGAYGKGGAAMGGGSDLPEMLSAAVPEEAAAPPAIEEEQTEDERSAAARSYDDLILGLNPQQEGQIIGSSQVDSPDSEIGTGWSVLRWVQIGLGLLAMLGAAGYWLKRKRSDAR